MDFSKYFFGLGLILVGSLYLAEKLIVDFDAGYIISVLWPIVFIFIGLNTILSNLKNFLKGTILIVFGLVLIGASYFEIDIWEFWPVILIVFGILILFDNNSKFSGDNLSQDYINENVAFGGIKQRVVSKKFKGGKISAIFGAVEIDLTDVTVDPEGAIINCDSTFAGIEIVAPKNAEVKVMGTGILGAFENYTKTPAKKVGGVLVIKGSAIFGAVEIK